MNEIALKQVTERRSITYGRIGGKPKAIGAAVKIVGEKRNAPTVDKKLWSSVNPNDK